MNCEDKNMTELKKCGTCENLTRNENDPWESGKLWVISDYHGSDSLRLFPWCRTPGCIKKAKKLAKEYKKYLISTGLFVPTNKVKELEEKEGVKWDNYKE
jgi:hypothetical protein